MFNENHVLIKQELNQVERYRIAEKFGRGKVWRIDSFRAFGKRKFGELLIWIGESRTIHQIHQTSPRQTFPLYGICLVTNVVLT